MNYNPMAREIEMAHPENAEDEDGTSELLQEARKRVKTVNTAADAKAAINSGNAKTKKDVMHSYDARQPANSSRD